MHLKTVLLPAALTLVVASVAHGQMFQQQTTTRFPVQSEYSNQLTVVDIDGDGDLDIVWANGQGYSSAGVALKPRVYVNNGAGVFTDETDIRVPGVTGWFRGVEAGDADGDGDPDLILAQDFNKQPKLLINNGSGVFADETASRLPVQTLSSSRAQFADVDNDGDLDIALCHSGTSSRFGSGQPKLWLNNGSGVFTDATATNFPVGNISEQMDVIFGDVDGDFDLDLVVGTRASSPNQSRLWKNNGAGVFTNQTGFPADTSSYSWDLADIDGDGDLDGISINGGTASAELLAKNANGIGTSWTNASASITPNPSTDDNDSKFLDYDNDGDLDLFIGSLGSSERVYTNNGAGAFAQAANILPAVADSTLDIKVADVDSDGRYDVITAQGESGSFQNRIYMNISGPVDTRPPTIVRTEDVVPGANPAAHVVRAHITDAHTSDRGFHSKGVFLNYSFNGCATVQVPMKWTGNAMWRGTIPTPPAGAAVAYFVTAKDWAGNVGTGPTKTFTEAGAAGPVGDINGDGKVDGADIGLCIGNWGQAGGVADVNCDGIVDGADLGLIIGNWTG